jgi:hypothetical protein
MPNYLKEKFGVGPYPSALWAQASRLPTEKEELLSDPFFSPKVKAASLVERLRQKRVLRHWEKNWNHSRKESPAPLAVLLSHEPVVYTFPAGLADALESVRPCPRGVHYRISARLDSKQRDLHFGQMKSGWLPDGPTLPLTRESWDPEGEACSDFPW